MAGTIIAAVTDPDEFQGALSPLLAMDLVLASHCAFRVRLMTITLQHTRLTSVVERVSRIGLMSLQPNLARIVIPTSNSPRLWYDGLQVGPGEIVLVQRPGRLFLERTEGPTQWRDIVLPASVLLRFGRSLTGPAFTLEDGIHVWRPDAGPLQDLIGLHRASIRVSKGNLALPAEGDAGRTLEQQLLHAVIDCLVSGHTIPLPLATRCNAEAVARFDAALCSDPGRPVRITEVARSMGVLGRSLRVSCQLCLGMGARHYAQVRRMHLARRALRTAFPERDSVSSIARRYGFHDLSRFAGNYQKLYGELPSFTLRCRMTSLPESQIGG
jgi:AraC-like DNA-binding protein